MNNYNNPIIEQLPHHLKQYIVEQHYEHYTAVDHAVWRYVMRQNYHYLKDVAYYPYIPGLKKAGLTIEKIPDLQTMNDHLQKIGWGAVTVNGFIPSQAFMEFQAYRVLIIAADIRQIEHIEYTPAPDIIHESAGHAPIIGEPGYAAYLQFTGEVGSRALLSKKDQELFEATRHLAVLKELAGTPPKELLKAEQVLQSVQQNMGEPSEMALLSRLHWWTVEYGLIGNIQSYKIYGAGLLSSIGESKSCLRPEVKKIKYSLDAVSYPYDITQPQPQLFVTPNFNHLSIVLDEFANTLAYRRGGWEGLQKAIDAELVCTITVSSGLQISGIFKDNLLGPKAIFHTLGPTALAVEGRQLLRHSKNDHPNGVCILLDRLKEYNAPFEKISIAELKDKFGIDDQQLQLEFEAGIQVAGTVHDWLIHDGKLMGIGFLHARIVNTITGVTLKSPDAEIFYLIISDRILSVFSGAADQDAFEWVDLVPQPMPVSQYTEESLSLQALYGRIRQIREDGNRENDFPDIWKTLKSQHPHDWLAPLELLEILEERLIFVDLQSEIRASLRELQIQMPAFQKLIEDGLNTLSNITLLPGKNS